MQKPHLIRLLRLKGRAELPPFDGVCSACEKVAFQGNDEKELENQFDIHFRKVHMREDASQTAARIVKQATEGSS
jgi:hypothetical protein